MNHSCHTLLKSKVRDLLIFTSESLFHSQNMSNSLKNIYIFLYFFYAQNKSLLSLFTKEWLSLFTKEQCKSFLLFLTSECFFALSLTKNEQFARNTMCEFPTLVFEPNQRNLAFPQLYPWQTTCKCIKFEKAWNWPTL